MWMAVLQKESAASAAAASSSGAIDDQLNGEKTPVSPDVIFKGKLRLLDTYAAKTHEN